MTVCDGDQIGVRSIKSTMKMDVLGCKTPDMVRKEIWAHLLAYNLLRPVMAVAAASTLRTRDSPPVWDTRLRGPSPPPGPDDFRKATQQVHDSEGERR